MRMQGSGALIRVASGNFSAEGTITHLSPYLVLYKRPTTPTEQDKSRYLTPWHSSFFFLLALPFLSLSLSLSLSISPSLSLSLPLLLLQGSSYRFRMQTRVPTLFCSILFSAHNDFSISLTFAPAGAFNFTFARKRRSKHLCHVATATQLCKEDRRVLLPRLVFAAGSPEAWQHSPTHASNVGGRLPVRSHSSSDVVGVSPAPWPRRGHHYRASRA